MIRAIEAMLLMSTEPLSAASLAETLQIPETEVASGLLELREFYEDQDRGFRLRQVAGGWRMAVADDVAPIIEEALANEQRAGLSQAALETLAVIAYLQPTSRSRVAGVRGVNVDGVVRTLLVRGLIEQRGPDEVTGAMTFGTTSLFLEKMGLNSLAEMPDLAPLLPDAVALEAELRNLASDATQASSEEHT